MWRTRRLSGSKVKEMLANASSLLLLVPAGAFGVAGWFWLFEMIQGVVPWQMSVSWTSAAMCLVFVDLVYYLEHRFEHTHRLPWDLYHSVHHSSPEYDQTTGLRLSGFDALLTIGYLTPLVVPLRLQSSVAGATGSPAAAAPSWRRLSHTATVTSCEPRARALAR